MGKQLINKLLPVLEKIPWPEQPVATDQGRQAYTIGLEKVDSFDGDPQQLTAALRTFQSGSSQPFAFAGVAYTLIAAAKEKDGSYDQAGLEAAMDWLEKAQEMEPDLLTINFIEALIYIHSGRTEDARLILDYLRAQDATEYYLHRAEMAYWEAIGDVEKTVHWHQEAAESAITVPQRLRVQAHLAEEAIAGYKQAIHFNKDNYLLWHKLSLAYWQQENIDEAERANQYALRLKDFPAGRKLEEAIKEKKSDGGVLGRLFGNR